MIAEADRLACLLAQIAANTQPRQPSPSLALALASADFELLSHSSAFGGGGTITLAGADPTRWCIAFAQPASGNVRVWIDSTVSSGIGFLLTATSQPLLFLFRDHGALVNSGWMANAGAGVNLPWLEVLYRPQR